MHIDKPAHVLQQGDDLPELSIWMGDGARACVWAREIFEAHPDLSSYAALAEAASASGTWKELREAIVDRLRANGEYRLLTQILLYEGDVAGAIETLKPAEDVRPPG